MTVVKASFVDATKIPMGSGTLTYRLARIQESSLTDKIAMPDDEISVVTGGIATDIDLDAGPYSVHIQIGWFDEVFQIVVPASGPVQLWDLLEDQTPYEPPVVSLVKQYRDEAKAAAKLSVQTAAGIQDVAADARQVALDRSVVESAAGTVAADRQTVTEARTIVVAAKVEVEQAKDAIDVTVAAVEGTLETYGAQFIADRQASQQAATVATVQAGHSGDAAGVATGKAGEAAASALEAKGFRDQARDAVTGVISVGGLTGAVTKAQLGIDKVDNTRDADKEVSGPTQTALIDMMTAIDSAFQGILTSLDGKTTPTQAQAIATTAVAAVVDNSPAALDTLSELAAALGNDPNFATTVMNLIGQKAAGTHKHGAADIETGTLPIARGGIGRGSVVNGSFLRGAGTDAIEMRTPAQVRDDIGAAPVAHTHELNQINGLVDGMNYFDSAISGKPSIGTTSTTAMRGDGIQTVATAPTSGEANVLYCVPE